MHHLQAHRQASCSCPACEDVLCMFFQLVRDKKNGGNKMGPCQASNPKHSGSASPASSTSSAEPRPAAAPMASPTHSVSVLGHHRPLDGCGHNPWQNADFFFLRGKMLCKSSPSLPLIKAWKNEQVRM